MLRQVHLMALTSMHVNAPNCRCGWSTNTLVGRIYVRVYARAETDCAPSSTNAFTNLFSSIILLMIFHNSSALLHTLTLLAAYINQSVLCAFASAVNTLVTLPLCLKCQRTALKGTLRKAFLICFVFTS